MVNKSSLTAYREGYSDGQREVQQFLLELLNQEELKPTEEFYSRLILSAIINFKYSMGPKGMVRKLGDIFNYYSVLGDCIEAIDFEKKEAGLVFLEPHKFRTAGQYAGRFNEMIRYLFAVKDLLYRTNPNYYQDIAGFGAGIEKVFTVLAKDPPNFNKPLSRPLDDYIRKPHGFPPFVKIDFD